jgi:predicted nucleotidyltransferase
MVAETNIDIKDFINQLRDAAGANLASVILYGSAAAGDFVPDSSDMNLLCVLHETSFAQLGKLSPVVAAWTEQKNRAPLFMGMEELRRSADVFSIELLDMKNSYRVLLGEDILSALVVPTRFHRVQLEYELREKVILNARIVTAFPPGFYDAVPACAAGVGRASDGLQEGSGAEVGGKNRVRLIGVSHAAGYSRAPERLEDRRYE